MQFEIINADEVRLTKGTTEYTVLRKPDGFRVYCVNASSRAYRRGIPAGRHFVTLDEVEAAYKGLRGVSGAFLPPPAAITRGDVETLAQREGLDPIDLLTRIQGGVAVLGDESLLDRLCALKSEFIGE